MKNVRAYLGFKGEAQEAMQFYKDCLGGELLIQLNEGNVPKEYIKPGTEHHVMHSELTVDGQVILYASDMADEDSDPRKTNMSVVIICDGKEEVEKLYEKLVQGGEGEQPPQEVSWGTFAAIRDTFGIRWMLSG
jgi:PhnB protein